MISVIVASYNNAPYIGNCLESIISNTYRDLEIIVVDDCSTDDSIGVIKRYMEMDNRVRLIQNEVNIGSGMTRRRGIKAAKGEWISTVDADDWLNHDYFSTLLSYVTDNSIDMVYGHYKGHDNIPYRSPFTIPSKRDRLLSIKQNGLQFLNAALIKASLYHDIEYCGARFVEDTPTAIKLLYNANNIYVTPYLGYNWRTNNSSLTHQASMIELIAYIMYNNIEPLKWLIERDKEIGNLLKDDFINDLHKMMEKDNISEQDMKREFPEYWKEIMIFYLGKNPDKPISQYIQYNNRCYC